MARLFLLDGTSLAYRAYFALLRGGRGTDGRTPGLSTSSGAPTGAVYGFLSTVRKLLADHRPEYAGIAFDTAAPTLRHEAFADYKAHRKPMPEDLVLQLPGIFKAAEALRIPMLTRDGWEADDIIGTLARKAVAADLEVVLVTLDKDMYQLLAPRVSMLQLRTETRWIKLEDVPAEFGVAAHQVIDVLALWGDPTDNIPGVAGIGEKGARSLITTYGSLEGVYAHLDDLKPAMAARLRAGEADAKLSRELATIHCDLDLPFDLTALRVGEPDRDKLHALALEHEFRTLAREFAPIAAAPVAADTERILAELELRAFLARAGKSGGLALEPVASHAEPMRACLVGLGLASADGARAYLPLGHREGPNCEAARFSAAAAEALADASLPKTSSDLKHCALLLHRMGLKLNGLSHDLGLYSYLLDPGRPAHTLDALAVEAAGRPAPLLPAPARGEDRTTLGQDSVAGIAAERAVLTQSAAAALASRLAATSAGAVYRDIELPLIPVLVRMEERGVRLDSALLAAYSAELRDRLAGLTARIHELAGTEFNIHSPRQLGEILFEKMNLPVLKKTRKSKSASTDTEVLEGLAASYELPRLVLEHRELSKLKGTYVDALPELVNPITGRLHTSYRQTVAATGRLSSSDPNLQNIPIRTEAGRRIRAAFVADPGMQLVAADYSQIELRLLAHLSGDPELVRAFAERADVHTRTAATMLGMHEALVTPELRRRAKAMNFGIIYGMSPFGLARELGIAQSEAARLISDYFARYAGVRAWLDRTVAEARGAGQVRTLFGRIRPLPEILSENRTTREYAERTATNTPIQGTAADVIKLAMLRVDARLQAERREARILLQVHDELVLECPAGEVAAVKALVREEMEGAVSLSVPLEVCVAAGPNWLEAK